MTNTVATYLKYANLRLAAESPSAVANSQLHYGTAAPVFIDSDVVAQTWSDEQAANYGALRSAT